MLTTVASVWVGSSTSGVGRAAGTRRLLGAAALTAAAVLTACTTQITGSPVTATGGPPPGTVDIAGLDVGNYPTKPLPPMGTAGDPRVGAIVEAQRMANYVTGPWEVDAALSAGYASTAMVLIPLQLSVPALRDVAQAFDRHQMINGFYSSRWSKDETRILQNAVLRFPDPGAATAAADEIARIVAEVRSPVQTSPTQPAPIPGHPDARATSRTHNDGPKVWTTVRSATPRGPYVLLQQAQSTTGVEPAAALVAGALDRQGPLIDEFQATDPAKFAELPLDPTGLLAKTLEVPAKEATLNERTVYQRRGALHFQSDPAASSRTFDQAGMDLMSYAKANVYQARDKSGAQQVVDAFHDELLVGAKPANGVSELPGSRCIALAERGFYCLAVADRYAIEVNAMQLGDAHQRLAAQYAILMGG